jgi:hypothetical protein
LDGGDQLRRRDLLRLVVIIPLLQPGAAAHPFQLVAAGLDHPKESDHD